MRAYVVSFSVDRDVWGTNNSVKRVNLWSITTDYLLIDVNDRIELAKLFWWQ